MPLTHEQKQQVIGEYRTHEKDTGSSEVQVAILTHEIRSLTEHLKKHKKDFHTQRGLMQKVGNRTRLLRYLKRTKTESYTQLIGTLGLKR